MSPNFSSACFLFNIYYHKNKLNFRNFKLKL